MISLNMWSNVVWSMRASVSSVTALAVPVDRPALSSAGQAGRERRTSCECSFRPFVQAKEAEEEGEANNTQEARRGGELVHDQTTRDGGLGAALLARRRELCPLLGRRVRMQQQSSNSSITLSVVETLSMMVVWLQQQHQQEQRRRSKLREDGGSKI